MNVIPEEILTSTLLLVNVNVIPIPTPVPLMKPSMLKDVNVFLVSSMFVLMDRWKNVNVYVTLISL